METPIGDDEDSHLGDFIEDKNILAPEDAALTTGLTSATDSILNSLTERESKVIRMRFGIGLNTCHVYTSDAAYDHFRRNLRWWRLL